jgi:hypothetical protein
MAAVCRFGERVQPDGGSTNCCTAYYNPDKCPADGDGDTNLAPNVDGAANRHVGSD